MSEDLPKRIALVLNSLTGEELKGGKQDVSRVYSILTDPQKGMCLDSGSTAVYDCESRGSFEKILRSTLKGWNIKTQLVFYFSGHGDIRNNLYCLKMGLDNSEWYPFKNLMNELDLAGVRRAIIILDACHSGAALEGSKSLGDNMLNSIKYDIPQGITIIASSLETQQSKELPDGSSGVFTEIFCTGIETSLDGKGTNDGKIYVEDIVSYINHKLETEEQYSNFVQRSAFSLDRAEKKIWIAKGKKRENSTVLHSQDFLENEIEKIVQKYVTKFVQSQGNTTNYRVADLTKFVKDNVQNEVGAYIDLKLEKELKRFPHAILTPTPPPPQRLSSLNWRTAAIISGVIGVLNLAGLVLSNYQNQQLNQIFVIEPTPTSSQLPLEASISREKAVNLIQKYLEAKKVTFAPPYNSQILAEIATSEFYQKAVGTRNWLQSNGAYYRYKPYTIEVEEFVLSGNTAEIKVKITEDITLYHSDGSIDRSNSYLKTVTVIYNMRLINGNPKIYDSKII
ncbi:IMS domain-containing protein [Okeania sp. SIO1I7]|uniref:IMS domain-containing protein n=1 Tax=Okeania sp. SIO1I7 TaxID=2607772 RepID=UPI0013FBAAA1|nr:IMS domain-containing protein [Okeania sp. SIO1I7]NET24395.1 DUF4101 domain-containing protein [Okeania sp. SIO1I7]